MSDNEEIKAVDAEASPVDAPAENDKKGKKKDKKPEGMPGGKAKNFKKAMGMLFRFIGKYRAAIIISLILAVASVVIQILEPNFIKDITNLVTNAAKQPPQEGIAANAPKFLEMKEIYRLTLIVGGLLLGGAVIGFFQGFIMTTITQLVMKKMRTQITEKINRLPLKYFDSSSYGDILSRLTNDVDTIGQSLSMSIVAFVSSILLLIGLIGMMLYTNWILALVTVGTTLLGLGLMFIFMTRSQKYFRRQQKLLGDLNGQIEENYSGHNVVKTYNGGEEAKERFDNVNNKLKTAVRRANFFAISMNPLMNFIGNLGYAAICIVGVVLKAKGIVDYGEIAAFMIYARLFSNPLGQLAQAVQGLQSTAAASERVFEFLNQPELASESDKTYFVPEIKGAVEFKNVKFGYDPEKVIIKDFSADIRPGQKVAIVGPTGAGKTTLVNLLMRFYEIDEGSITVDGYNLQDLTREAVHRIFGMVLQDTWTFEGTVKENIVFNKESATDEDVVAVAKAANLDHFIRTLSNGYDTVIDDKANISAGQKQLMTIARAMLEDAPVLILDEATSSVDTRTEILIQEAMDRLTKGRTSFVIAHRLSTIKNADLILVLRDGDIVEKGNHEELLAAKGFYSELYNSQFSD